MLGLLVTGALVAGGVVVVLTGDESSDGEAAGGEPRAESAGEDEGTAEQTVPTAPAELFAFAADRLEDESTFTFEGTTRFEGTLPEQSGVLVVQEGATSGRAELPGVYVETTEESDGGGFEIIIDEGVTWWRRTASADRLGERPWVRDEGLSDLVPRPALHRLPDWLGAATDHRDGGEDENGRTVVVSNLPPGALDEFYATPPDQRFIRAELTVTVDDTGLPVRMELEGATSDAVVELSYRLTDFGATVEVVHPTDAELDGTPFFMEEDIAEYGGPAPHGLARAPAGWSLVAGYVLPEDAIGCTSVELVYGSLASPDLGFLAVVFTGPECMPPPPGEVQPFTAGAYTGVVSELPGEVVGSIDVGGQIVGFRSDLSVADLSLVLASLGPLDLAAQPTPIEGLPSSPD
jgi:hypothetical protein